MFERFTPEARRVTVLASEEARLMGHDLIGTEHLLLGLLSLDEGVARDVLTEFEVTLDDARRKVSERVHPYGMGGVDSPSFSPLAKKALERSLREALRLEARLIGSEHLLLGLVAVPDGGGARILTELAGSLDQVQTAVLDRIATPAEPTPAEAPLIRRTFRRSASSGRAVPTPPPLCPACQSSLEAEARYRRLEVASDSGPDVVSVTVVYCGHCGVALGVA